LEKVETHFEQNPDAKRLSGNQKKDQKKNCSRWRNIEIKNRPDKYPGD